MKSYITIYMILWLTSAGLAQNVAINEDGSLPDPSAILDLQSGSRGLLIPRMTTAEMGAIENPAPGLLVYGTDHRGGLFYFDGAEWTPVGFPDDAPGAINDVDGNSYGLVRIGAQYWMQENLRVTRFRNGDPVPELRHDADWLAASGPALSGYNNLPDLYAQQYGLLYNRAAANDPRGLCPAGMRVATAADWEALSDHLGEDAGGALKALSGWESPNAAADNLSGFSAFPSGIRDGGGAFMLLGFEARFHVAGTVPEEGQAARKLRYDSGGLYEAQSDPSDGLSIRCVFVRED